VAHPVRVRVIPAGVVLLSLGFGGSPALVACSGEGGCEGECSASRAGSSAGTSAGGKAGRGGSSASGGKSQGGTSAGGNAGSAAAAAGAGGGRAGTGSAGQSAGGAGPADAGEGGATNVPRGGSSSGGEGGGAGSAGEVLAFPGAQGFGARVTGGRGGRVIKVTTLNADGPGSLQEALNRNEPRIVVFSVSGVIDAEIIEIPYGDVTIAGQSAPGGGITIRGRLFAAYDESVGNISVRHLRVRPEYDGSAGEQFDAIQFSLNHHFILDHLSVSGGVDENVDLYAAQDATVQWSTIESSGTEGHPEGEHNYGLINGPEGRRVSVHHNLFAHHKNRSPAIANGPAEIYNNVVYDVRHGFIHHNPASGPFNIVGNTFRTGSEDTLIPFYFDDENDEPAADLGYALADNWLEGTNSDCPVGLLSDPWSQCDYDLHRDASFARDSLYDFGSAGDAHFPIVVDPAAAAWDAVLGRAGAFPRDMIARTSVEDTQTGMGGWGAPAVSDLMAGLTPTAAPADTDDDGMPDAWETTHGLDPETDDSAVVVASGYTAIEEYLNELADDLAR
jgi:pectate lyase